MPLATARRLSLAATAAAALVSTALVTPAVADAATNTLVVTVLDPSGHLVPGVWVDSEGDSLSGTTDAKGRIVFADAPAGQTYPCASLRQDQPLGGTAGWYPACAVAQVHGTTRVTLHFKAGGAVGGVVTDARTGATVAGASVGYYDIDAGGAVDVTADAAGRYLIRNLTPGQVPLLGANAEQIPTSAIAPFGYLDDVDAHVGTPVQVSGGTVRNDLNLRVTPAVRWSGTVRDGSGAAVPQAFVAVGRAGDHTTAVAGKTGAFSVLRPWGDGGSECSWSRATATHPTGLAAVCTDIALAGTSVTRTITLPDEGGVAVGRVIAPGGGAPTGTLSVGVTSVDGGFVVPGIVKRNGTYRVEGLPSDIEKVQVTSRPSGAVADSPQFGSQPGRVSTLPDIVLSTGD